MDKITFNNEPKLSEHEVQKNMNERRISLVPFIKDFILTHERFKDKKVSVTFIHKGAGSLLTIIDIFDEKLILKISLGKHGIGEAQFLRAWEQAGVKVPHVFEEGLLNGYSYTLMEHVDAPILGEIYSSKELIEKGIYLEIGRTLRIMHEPRAEGYGRVVDGRGEYAEFKDWIMSEDIQKRFEYTKENFLLGNEHGSLAIALEILTEHINKENKSSYCHDDFGVSNIFATNPITIFDPNPKFNNRYLDLGRTILMTAAQSNQAEIIAQLIKGYFEGKPYDKKALHASILLNSHIKFFNWHRINKLKGIENVQEYLIQNRHLLET